MDRKFAFFVVATTITVSFTNLKNLSVIIISLSVLLSLIFDLSVTLKELHRTWTSLITKSTKFILWIQD